MNTLAPQLGRVRVVDDEVELATVLTDALLYVMEQELDRLEALLARLLQSGHGGVAAFCCVDIRDEISKTLEPLEGPLRQQHITVVKAFAPTIALIQADRQQLRQLLLNLCSNASDAMPDGGTLMVRAGMEGEGVRVDILDTGIGISPINLTRVMDPFFTTKPAGKGNGLGLPICRRIIQEHGGTIEITSAGVPGQGTNVHLTLPAAKGISWAR
jgi:signal transduction histidine kinase